MISKINLILILFTFFVLAHAIGCDLDLEKKGEQIGIKKVELKDKVKAEFLHAWNGYKQYAWGHDELMPISKSYHDWHEEPFYLTAIDAFDTMILLELQNEAQEAKQLISKNLSFDKDIFVKNFEITIRVLGGLLSAYQLDGDKLFLELAKDLGNRLLPVFNSPTGIPYRYVNLRTGATRGNVNNPAEIGTLLIEFGTLSKLTNNPIYYEKAKNALIQLYKRRSEIGLMGSNIDIETGEWVNKESHISGGIDSYYEYLLKSWLLFGDEDCKRMWENSIKAINTYLTDSTESGLWYGHADMITGKRTRTNFGALDAFFPAVLALSGNIERAEKLQASCYKMWKMFDIEPEQLDYKNMKILAEPYLLRPENIESAYYLYHYTKDERYLKMGREYFESLMRYCKTEVGYAGLKSVVTKEKSDVMESFFLAETLKYLYLLFAPQEMINFEKVIFNTEAHPIKRTWD